MGRSRRIAVSVALAAALLAGGVAVGLSGDSGNRDVDLAIDLSRPGRSIPASFLGLSIEYESIAPYAGPAGARNVSLARLLRRLGAASGAPVALRVGGNSTDQSLWNPKRLPQPDFILLDITRHTLGDLAWILEQTGGPVTLGLNLAVGDPRRAVAFVRAAQRQLPSGGLRAVEIGNEPDLYTEERVFHVGSVLMKRLRKRARYEPSEYEEDVEHYLTSLATRLRRPPELVVGSLARTPWVPSLLRLVDRRVAPVDGISGHFYPLVSCEDERPPSDLISQLLSDESSRAMLEKLGPLIDVGHARGVEVHVSELNSAICGGVPGVSDALAAALWLPDALFTLAARGADGVTVHSFAGAHYAPFDVVTTNGRPRTTPRPLYFGMLLFTKAAVTGSRLVPVTTPDQKGVRAWATADRKGTTRVVLINATADQDREVRLTGAPRGQCARLERLLAPSLGAREGVRLTSDGRVCSRDDAYRVDLPPASAALITIGRAATR